MYPVVRGRYGLRDGDAPTLAPTPDNQVLQGLDQQIQNRKQRSIFLEQYGEPFWLPVSLGLPSPAASAGATYSATSANQDFDLLLIGAECSIRLSTVEIIDSARNRALTNGAVPIPSFAQIVTSGGVITFPFDWSKPYFLPAKAQLRITTTADGTETGGTLTFRCLMPPVYQG